MQRLETLVQKLSQLEHVTSQFEDVIKSETELTKKECKISSVEELEKTIGKLKEDGRLLTIGIIGRVKAGKSSLLNSVFFDGKAILPKAATPMTASLTVLTHGEAFAATVEYYTGRDIEVIKKAHDDYKTQFDNALAEQKKSIEERLKKRGESLSVDEINAKATRRAKEEVKNEHLAASFDQYDRMVKSGKLAQMRDHQGRQNLHAKKLSELMGQLNQYVGADGSFMPFTKSVEIQLPMDSLRDIQVVDTPGINDPVISRTERTNEYLRNCDVVLIVSPAGQFITSEDINLMDQLSAKEGVHELYLVASQVDSQLHGSEGEEAEWDMNKALSSIRSHLSGQATDSLRMIKERNPEVAGQFDQLIQDGEERVLVTSAISHAMSLRFAEKQSWDEDMKKAWELLSEHYADYFNSDASARASLEKLSGVDDMSKKIDLAREAKDSIIARKQADYLIGQGKAIDDYQTELIKAVAAKLETLKNTDIKKIHGQKKKNEKLFSKGSEAIDGAFDDCVDEFKLGVRNEVSENSRSLLEKARGDVKDSEETTTETKTGTRKGTGAVKKFFSWISKGKWGNESYNYTIEVFTVRTGAVKSALNNLINDLRDKLVSTVESRKIEWKKSVQSKTTGALMAAVDVDLIDIPMLKTALRRMVNNMELPPFDLSSHAFTSSNSGVLQGVNAERFIDEALRYIDNLRTFFNEQSENFISTVERTAKREKMSDLIFTDLREQLETLEKELENKKQILDRLGKCLTDIWRIA
jgi:predicted GTPase